MPWETLNKYSSLGPTSDLPTEAVTRDREPGTDSCMVVGDTPHRTDHVRYVRKRTVPRHEVRSHDCVTITAIHFPYFFTVAN